MTLFVRQYNFSYIVYTSANEGPRARKIWEVARRRRAKFGGFRTPQAREY